MKLNTLYSDSAKTELLVQCLTATSLTDSNLPALPADLQAQLATLAVTFHDAQLDLIAKRERFKLQNQAFRKREAQLCMLIRHAWQAVKRRHQSESLPTSIILAFGLRANATQPSSMRNIKEPGEIAARMLNAHERATERHYWILIDPSPASFRAALEAQSQARAERAQARSEEGRAFAAMVAMRQQVNVLIAQIKTYLRMRYQGQPSQSLRDALRAFGFSFTASDKASLEPLSPDTAMVTEATTAAAEPDQDPSARPPITALASSSKQPSLQTHNTESAAQFARRTPPQRSVDCLENRTRTFQKSTQRVRLKQRKTKAQAIQRGYREAGLNFRARLAKQQRASFGGRHGPS